ncbi:MAG: NAD(P)/FAD-dependent oxidoreductase [Gammaproteobacteria bacterium]|nr:NAD(P)/FAD-dependent oxidoreductase [Gammaproteobacteria bacterium]
MATSPEVVIVGAGPAGLSAALALDAAGLRVRVVDEQPAPGGQIYRAVDKVFDQRPGMLGLYGSDYSEGRKITGLLPGSGVELSAGSTVWDISIESDVLSIGLLQQGKSEILYPKHIILATGAMERPTPFPGWTLPGVMTVGAAQTLFKDSALVPDSRPVIVGSGPLVYLFTRQLIACGIDSAVLLDTGSRSIPVKAWKDLLRIAVSDPRPLMKGMSWLRTIRHSNIEHQYGITSLLAKGENRLQSIEYSRNGKTFELETDLLLVHDGVIPNSHLAMAAGCEHRWNDQQSYWQPVLDENGLSSQGNISIIGDSAGITGAESARWSGQMTGWHVARQLGYIDELRYRQETQSYHGKMNRISTLRRFLDACYPPFDYFQTPLEVQTIVCRCEGVRSGEIQEVAKTGCMGPNQGKAFTRCGMGPCMGRQCGNAVSQIFAHCHGKTVEEIGHYKIRSPIRPITVGELSRLTIDH